MNSIAYLLIVLAGIAALSSCSSNRKHEASSEDFKKLDTIVTFSGNWISENYYNSIKEFKSPLKAQDGALFIEIPERTLRQTIAIYNFHEGGPFLKVLKTKSGYGIWEVQDDSLVTQAWVVEILSPTKIKLGETVLEKINCEKQDGEYLVLEEILFKGKYQNAAGDTVEFKNNGEMAGLDSFKFYSVNSDYYDAGLQVDQVGFTPSEDDNWKWHGFKFSKDTLRIYQLNCLAFDSTYNQCVEVGYGKLRYEIYRNN